MDKKFVVTAILKEMNDIIAKALDKGEGENLTPLELIYILSCQLLEEMQKMEDEFDKKDSTSH